jgi:hypothetical protein
VNKKRYARNVNGSALLVPYFAPTNPVAHKNTNMTGAIRISHGADNWLKIIVLWLSEKKKIAGKQN